MVFLDQVRSIAPRCFVRQILLISCEGSLLNDPSIYGQSAFIEKTLNISDAPFQLVD
jgi:hypothetical protein